jgi:REP element-mobilizing transposase RayT
VTSAATENPLRKKFEPPYVGCYKAVMEPNLDRAFYLPRLPCEYYQGDAVVHWTLSIAHRKQGWLDETFHAAFRELLLHTAAREGLFCPTYCLMPDHLHLVWMGLRLDSDQLNGMAFLRTHLKPKLAPQKFQHQPHDHVLKEEERRRDAFALVCHYILENPLRAELVNQPDEWKFSGAVGPGYPTLHPLQDVFWEKFWKLYAQAKHLDAGKIVRPPIR